MIRVLQKYSSAWRRAILLLLATAGAAVMATSVWAAGAKRPNIVFLMTDDQTTYSLGCYGNSDVKTPNIDELASAGVVFDNHYATTAICMASRANVMTGLYEYRHGCNFEHGPLLQDHWNKAYPNVLREGGYTTAIAGKIGFVVARRPGEKGRLPIADFDMWGAGPGQTTYVTKKNESMAKYAEQYPHSTLSYGAFGRDFIRKASTESKPFCLSISFKAPHKPATPDPKFDAVYADKTFRKPKNYGRRYGEHFSKQSRQGRQFERFHSWEYSSNYDNVMATYHQQIFAVDVAVGMIRDALREARVEDNTIVIFTSDNGFMCGSHGYGSKVLPYEESARIPLVIYDPRHANSGKELRSQSLTGNIDMAPTILDYAGIAAPVGIDGRSLVSAYDDPSRPVHQSLTLINVWGPRPVFSLSVVTPEWKYIYWPFSKDGYHPTEELYSMKSDRLELTNVATTGAGDAEALAAMRKQYDKAVSHWKDKAVDYHRYDLHQFFARRSDEQP